MLSRLRFRWWKMCSVSLSDERSNLKLAFATMKSCKKEEELLQYKVCGKYRQYIRELVVSTSLCAEL